MIQRLYIKKSMELTNVYKPGICINLFHKFTSYYVWFNMAAWHTHLRSTAFVCPALKDTAQVHLRNKSVRLQTCNSGISVTMWVMWGNGMKWYGMMIFIMQSCNHLIIKNENCNHQSSNMIDFGQSSKISFNPNVDVKAPCW